MKSKLENVEADPAQAVGHAPGPSVLRMDGRELWLGDTIIAVSTGSTGIERGKEIVQRYNQYDALLDALEQLIADIESTHVDGEELERSFYPPTMEQARAAVVAARGGDK